MSVPLEGVGQIFSRDDGHGPQHILTLTSGLSMHQSHASLPGIVNNDTWHQRKVTQVGNSLHPGSAAQQSIDQEQDGRANGKCGDGFLFDEGRDAVECIAVGFG